MNSLYIITILIFIYTIFHSNSNEPIEIPTPKEKVEQSSLVLDKEVKSNWIRAIGYAEGTLDINGNRTIHYGGHIDPGNSKFNKGFCSANGFKGSVEEADKYCLSFLRKALDKGLDKIKYKDEKVILNYLDLYNQSPSAASNFYKFIKGKDDESIKLARVNSFEGSATGLFFNCRNNGYYVTSSSSLSRRNHCIKKNQEQRLNKINQILEKG
jgi:hypothetical protein